MLRMYVYVNVGKNGQQFQAVLMTISVLFQGIEHMLMYVRYSYIS